MTEKEKQLKVLDFMEEEYPKYNAILANMKKANDTLDVELLLSTGESINPLFNDIEKLRDDLYPDWKAISEDKTNIGPIGYQLIRSAAEILNAVSSMAMKSALSLTMLMLKVEPLKEKGVTHEELIGLVESTKVGIESYRTYVQKLSDKYGMGVDASKIEAPEGMPDLTALIEGERCPVEDKTNLDV